VKESPIFSVDSSINKVEEYIPFRHTKAYIKSCADKYRNKHELLLLVGYGKNSYSKFCNREADWLSFQRSIPLKYLSAIGAELSQIEIEAAADRNDYENVLKLPLPNPQNAVVRAMATVYFAHKFEPGTSEAEAIEIMKTYSTEKGMRCCINYPGIKSIWIEPGQKVGISFYFPTITITKTELVPSYMGQGIGKAYLA
jgi:hypothetical protein